MPRIDRTTILSTPARSAACWTCCAAAVKKARQRWRRHRLSPRLYDALRAHEKETHREVSSEHVSESVALGRVSPGDGGSNQQRRATWVYRHGFLGDGGSDGHPGPRRGGHPWGDAVASRNESTQGEQRGPFGLPRGRPLRSAQSISGRDRGKSWHAM